MVASEEINSQEPAKVPDFTTIEVVLTYDGYDPMSFKFRRSLGRELRALQKEFYGLTDEEQDAQQHAHRVTFLGSLLREHPTNVPNYPVHEEPTVAFISYFSTNEMEDMIDHIWVDYQGKVYPKELTSSISK